MKYLLITLIFIIQTLSFAQSSTSSMIALENEISHLTDKLRAEKNDTTKVAISHEIVAMLKEAYTSKEAFNYTFSKVKSIGFINSPDNLVKIINWNIQKEDFTNQYFGIIVRYDNRKKEYITYELTDNSGAYDVINDNGYYYSTEWYGALYYKIIPTVYNRKTSYILLGYDANNKTSHIKLIDVLSFIGSKAKFGAPIFQNGKKTVRRAIFEHSKKSYMSIKYEPERNRIVFDHLSPESPIMADFREFYVPDMSYDAYVLEHDKWVLHEDIVAINAEKEKDVVKVYDMNKKGEIVETQQKNTWRDPSDKNAPAGSNIHTPALPEPVKNTRQKKVPAQKIDNKALKNKKRSSGDSYYQNILKSNSKKKKKANKKRKIKKVK